MIEIFSSEGESMQIMYKRTIVGWFNVYLIGTNQVLNMPPEVFAELFPESSANVVVGCTDITASKAKQVGFDIDHVVGSVAV